MKLPWGEQEDFIFRQMLLLVSTARFNDMECIAIVLAALKKKHRNFVVLLLDHIFEQVVRGIEDNDFKDAQRRVSVMKFLAECFNYKVIHTDTLLCLMYKLINWDIIENREDAKMAELDSLDDCFRIRLVCTILDSLGKFFNKGKRGLLMDRYLIFLKRYILSKHYILMDLEFMILDTFDTIRPRRAPKLTTLEEANIVCNKIVQAESNFSKPVDLTNVDDVSQAMHDMDGVSQIIQQYCSIEGPKV